MHKEPQQRLTELLTIVNGWKLNKVHLASKAKINAYTFKMKLAGNNPAYKFTDSELDAIEEVLKELAQDIENTCGISFNKALATISRKKV